MSLLQIVCGEISSIVLMITVISCLTLTRGGLSNVIVLAYQREQSHVSYYREGVKELQSVLGY